MANNAGEKNFKNREFNAARILSVGGRPIEFHFPRQRFTPFGLRFSLVAQQAVSVPIQASFVDLFLRDSA
jgi:hypothetical protein